MTLQDIKDLELPQKPGCYQYFNAKGELIYIGKAVNLRSRVSSYWRDSANHTPAKSRMVKEIKEIKWIEVDSEIEALLLEANLIKAHRPYYNILMRDDKRFNYIYISTADEIPGVYLTRTTGKPGKYYGPFVSGLAVKETLKALRRIWPYCTMRSVQKKPCFYYQIGRCLGPCGGKVTLKEYNAKVIKPLILFFEGRKNRVLKQLPPDMREYAEQVLENTKVLSVGEKYASDVVELAKVLGLPKVPERIEGYDISNIFGQQAVGSMVVFGGGEPDKSQYRKFKIKLEKEVTDRKKGDVWMLEEMIERRLNNDWLLPDLIIVDGGKAQLNIATRVLKRHTLDIPLIGITKGEGLRSAKAPDKLFFPGEIKPLELPLASAALHLIKRVRDEAHRFAITYHRNLRSKRFLS